MKNRFVAFSILYILFAAQTCSNNNHKRAATALSNVHYHKIDFINFIAKHKNDTIDFYEEFLGDKEFVNVLEHGEFYKNDVNTFLSNGVFSNCQVAVCICAMQILKVNDYVKLCNIIFSLYNANKVTEPLLQDAICPDFLRKRIIINNYGNPQVSALLQSMLDDKKLTDKDFRKWLPGIISGKSSKDLKRFDENSGEASD